MANPHKFYLSHMNAKTGYRATWDPGRPLQIGQVGKLDGSGIFSVFSTLEKEGIPIEVLSDESSGEMDYTSNESVNISVKLAGSAPAAGSVLTDVEAGFSFEFKSEKAVVFQTSGHKTHQLVNLGEIEKLVLKKFNDGNWEKDWLIVTQLVAADTATIIISNSSNGKLELKAKAGAGTANLKLTDASLGLTVAREQGSTLKYITQNGLTPLYRLMGIRHPLFGKKQLATRSDKEQVDQEKFRLQEFDNGETEQ
jgi:hypothetical protein